MERTYPDRTKRPPPPNVRINVDHVIVLASKNGSDESEVKLVAESETNHGLLGPYEEKILASDPRAMFIQKAKDTILLKQWKKERLVHELSLQQKQCPHPTHTYYMKNDSTYMWSRNPKENGEVLLFKVCNTCEQVEFLLAGDSVTVTKDNMFNKCHKCTNFMEKIPGTEKFGGQDNEVFKCTYCGHCTYKPAVSVRNEANRDM